MIPMRTVAFGLLVALALVGIPGGASDTAPTPTPHTSGWTVEPVALFGGSSPPQIALASDGVPQVLYCPVGQAWWANRTPPGWAAEFVTPTPGGGGCGGLALAPDGTPRIYMYSEPPSESARAMLWTRIGGSWSGVNGTVPSGSLAVDSLGRAHIAAEEYVPNGTEWDHFLHYGMYDGLAWNVTRVDFYGTTSFAFIGAHWESLALDAQDNPHVLYYDPLRGDVRYAFRNATGW